MPLGTLLSGGKAHHLLQKSELDPLPPVCLEKAVLHPLYSVSPSPSALPNEASVEKPAEYMGIGIHEALTQIVLGRGSQWPGQEETTRGMVLSIVTTQSFGCTVLG